MSKVPSEDVDLASLQADIQTLRRDVASLLDHLKLAAAEGAEETAGRLEDGARRAYRAVAGPAERSADAVAKQIEEQPLVALLLALGVGYIAGRLLSR